MMIRVIGTKSNLLQTIFDNELNLDYVIIFQNDGYL
jgi:hypothetical protein